MKEIDEKEISDELINILRCRKCDGDRFAINGASVSCRECQNIREISEDGILLDRGLLEKDDAEEKDWELLKYESDTKQRYQETSYAKRYLNRYRKLRRPADVYHWFIARRERLVTKNLIGPIASSLDLVLDVPAGTGKLAEVHRNFNYSVLASDVSAGMLSVGRTHWREGGGGFLGMFQGDITDLCLRNDVVDCSICLRLMHRLPIGVLKRGIRELARVSRKYVLVSNGVGGWSLAKLGNRVMPLKHPDELMSLNAWHEILKEIGTIEGEEYVARGISKEVVTLVKVHS